MNDSDKIDFNEVEVQMGTDLPCVLFDTNVVLDLLFEREPYLQDSAKAVARMFCLQPRAFVSASAITDLYYVLSRNLKNQEQVYEALEKVFKLFAIADVTAMNIYSAYAIKPKDFEDAVAGAVAASQGFKYVITRNTKDFEQLPVTAITPTEFLAVEL
jgi:predicted nucleic acid-binding protein